MNKKQKRSKTVKKRNNIYRNNISKNRYILEVKNNEGIWKSAKKYMIENDTKVEFSTLGEVERCCKDIESQREKGVEIIEGRIIERKTGILIREILPSEAKEVKND